MLEANYAFNDTIEVGASFLSFEYAGFGFTEELYGLGGQYNFGFGGYARADAGRSQDGDTFSSVEVGFTF